MEMEVVEKCFPVGLGLFFTPPETGEYAYTHNSVGRHLRRRLRRHRGRLHRRRLRQCHNGITDGVAGLAL